MEGLPWQGAAHVVGMMVTQSDQNDSAGDQQESQLLDAHEGLQAAHARRLLEHRAVRPHASYSLILLLG